MAGHAVVQDRAFISGNCLVHQFTRVGTLAMMRGGAAISQDLPPFTLARGENCLCGLNIVGLRRSGFTPAERLELKRLYHTLFRKGMNLSRSLPAAQKEFLSPASRTLLEFVATARRGVCRATGRDMAMEPPIASTND